jgi:nucleoside-diphosphate-sugar epimerase
MPDHPASKPKQDSQAHGGKRFLVTGAKGCIGAWIVALLVEGGERPFVFDIDPTSERLKALLTETQLQSVNFIQGDITRFVDLDQAIADNGVTVVVHLAGLQVPACAADPVRGAMINVIGTLNLFEVTRKRRDLVKRIVYASSAAVFGPDELYGGRTVTEGAALLPGTHYGVFKQCNEGNARVYFQDEGISSVGIRPWAVYGFGRDQGITAGPTKAIKAAVLSRPYTIRFTGPTDLQYVRDTAEIFIDCAAREITGARVYTPRGNVIRIEEFLRTLQEMFPASRELVRAEGKALPFAADLDDSALRRDLGTVHVTPLEEGIRQTAVLFDHLAKAGTLDTADLES